MGFSIRPSCHARGHGKAEWAATDIDEDCDAAAEANAIAGEVQSGESKVRISGRNLRFARVDRLKMPIGVDEGPCAGQEGRNQPREADIDDSRFL